MQIKLDKPRTIRLAGVRICFTHAAECGVSRDPGPGVATFAWKWTRHNGGEIYTHIGGQYVAADTDYDDWVNAVAARPAGEHRDVPTWRFLQSKCPELAGAIL